MDEFVDFQCTLFEREQDHLFVPTPEQAVVFIKTRLAQVKRLEDLDLTISDEELGEMFYDWLRMQIPERSFDQIQQRFPGREDQIVQMVETVTSLNQFYEIEFTPPNSVETMLYSGYQYQSGVINFSGIVRQRKTYLIYQDQPVLVVLPHKPQNIGELDYESPAIVAGFVRNQIGSILDPETRSQIPVMVMSVRRRADK